MARRIPILTGMAISLAATALFVACSSASPAASSESIDAPDAQDEAAAPAQETYILQQSIPQSFNVTSTSLKVTGFLLPDFTCEGAEFGEGKVSDTSPHIGWEEVPSDTQSIAVVAEDLDLVGAIASHWIVWGLPPDTTELPAGASGSGDLPTGSVEGVNTYREPGYKGPCPPTKVKYTSGCINTGYVSNPYRWSVYALGKEISLDPGATRDDLLRAIDGNVVASGSLDVKYISKKTAYPICQR